MLVADPFFDKLNKMPSTENRALERAAGITHANSRLACCVQIRPELNEMICVVGNNRTTDGDWFAGKDPESF